ncbi:1-phosphofructokinase [Streptococcus pseudoporcinus]|uniref:Tagatose-6-phosphate kinase n=1 Tax=Streptococcus pseudoporcinus TaxID=361101 RepID=A0A4U9XLH4_9STRE|nr:1-phosphofructokinase [Streptococcus pseudoporcinus]VTS13886.1 1-phosphofructokinase [Streptococcus pseudoporcinus]VUC66860.1 1-phosphofructokinase [Streptococcus pseudoporcinus]VUC97788.1 1-phosphofructokinase [Streptococcus pseudoporcinus]VUC98180.1 1-phosphofructokinase [Streptococcus pseudoporcinus]
MIYTVTLNPSIDFIVRIDHLETGSVNRMASDDKFAGGKGINVSRILQRLDNDNIATGFIGGFTGQFIEESLRSEQITTHFIPVKEDTRINVKIKSDLETEINGAGPEISDFELQAMKEALSKLSENDTVVFAGSAPSNLGNTIYNELIPIVRSAGAQIICDFEGQTLLDALAYHPLLVKPNNHELEAIFKTSLKGLDDVETYARKLIDRGAQNVIVSMAGDGALLVTQDASYFAKPIKGTVKNSVGAGDSMVAGFTGQFVRTKNPIEALKWGVACGTATAFSDDLATSNFIEETYQKVEVEKR